MINKYLSIGIFCPLFVLNIQAEEGMWQLSQLPDLNLEKIGFEISAGDIYSPDKLSISTAIVWLGGCSASFVSADGLVLTNHHCAYGSLQRNSAKDSIDYIDEGFLAKDRSEELPAIGQHAYVLKSMADVTDVILKSVKGIEALTEKEKRIEQKITAMEKEAENDREDRYCYIATNYNGKQYVKYLFNKYQDVRIVFAPPAAIGNYGGDIDNWMWPRHTGDFTYLRVYQAPDGSGAKYSDDNIPLKPGNYLKIAKTDLKDGDMTFILGYPGRTMRYRSSYSVDWNLNRTYIPRIERFQSILDIITEMSNENQEAKLKLASYDAGLNNTMKNFQGNVDGMQSSNFIENKRAFEADLMSFINSKRKLKKMYGDVMEKIAAQYAILEQSYDYDQVLENFGGYTIGVLYNLGSKAYDVARERAKPETDRRPEFSEKRVKDGMANLDYAYLRFYEPFDKTMLTRALQQAAKLPEEQRITALDFILKGSMEIDAWVDDAFAKTGLKDIAYVKDLYNKTPEEIEALNDPLIDLAIKLYDAKDRKYEEGKVWNAQIQDLRKKYIDALYAWKGQSLYPDANSTMRFTFGKVKGYKPADGIWYEPFTTLKGVVEKDTGEEPFNNPAKLTELSRSKDYGKWIDPELGDVPSCFLAECDITGGNSGSAVMNAKGELIGLAFDGNYEAMTSDWLYNPELQRTIVVDIRYVLFITDKFAGADYLLKEMGI
ncbi:MAG: S46 family peptidase [Candidatus Marinimicrobia bacterium]|nr:S46 family peptidase [Candidatus Neomarinimicrobiota bacterium]